MGSLIDSGIFIAAERRQIDLDDVLRGLPQDEDVAIAAITASELLHGVLRADPARRPAREALVERWLSLFPVLPFDLTVARTYAKLSVDRVRQGKPVQPQDLMIAATALTHGFRVVTRDLRSFPTIAGLDVLMR